MIKLVVPGGQNECSLVECIMDMLPAMRPGDLAKLMRKGDVKVNGFRTRRDVTIYEGDVIEIYVAESYAEYLPETEIVYEDENMLIFNKQPGMSCVDDKNNGKPTLYNVAEQYMKETGEFSIETLSVPYVCHRLDHNTGGLVIVAKNQSMFESIVEAFRQRRIRKFYKAIVCGHPRRQAELQGYILKDSFGARVKVVREPGRGAQPAVTRYTLEENNGDIALLNIELVTGRTHQARAHLASVGLPILGDDKYGDRRMNKLYAVRYQALWAYKIVFETGRNNELEYMNGRTIETRHIMFPFIEKQGAEPSDDGNESE